MWLFTDFGFFSVVQKPDTSCLTVRSRVGDDLDRLRERYLPELSDTVVGGGTDYPFRATVSHADFAAGLSRIASALDYSNFKYRVEGTLGRERSSVYGRVWQDLLALETPDERE